MFALGSASSASVFLAWEEVLHLMCPHVHTRVHSLFFLLAVPEIPARTGCPPRGEEKALDERDTQRVEP